MDQNEKSNGHLNKIFNHTIAHVLNPASLRHLAREWLKEDIPSFDFAGFVVGEKEESAVILIKSPGVLAGCPFVDAVFKELDCKVEWIETEGQWIEPIKVVGKVTGKVRHLLLGERIALNCLCRASGIATCCKKLLNIASKCNWYGELAGTRKTTPGFRMVEKYALLVGGVSTHRYDQSSMIMLKDNHIWTAGSVAQAVKDARVVGGFSTKIEVECRSIEEAVEAIKAGSDVIMLDNFSPEAICKASKELKQDYPHVLIEASGGITENNLMDYCMDSVDVISVSKLVQGYSTVDLSMKIQKEGRDPQNPMVNL